MAPKKAQPAAPVRRSTRIASKEAVSYTPTTARVIKPPPATKTPPKKAAKKTPAKKSAAPKAAPVKKATVKKSAAPKKAPVVKKAPPKQSPEKKVRITTTPSDSVPSSSKIIRYPTASKKEIPRPKKDSRKDSDAKAPLRKSEKKVVGEDETDVDERIPSTTGIGSSRRGG
ncbi:hypothetical protein NA56DRAFT_654478 [Hyaloscypha hepaticicola]|uniref:Uncharacterized protein n=1 Tax=Hyaloscypha hepaticicola TaxID=2082293 RepID=A0A2J6QK79_9HELO|nr:hypothetical protein NA56DRAFT_654478 [Hyaloscypha hepaticicola]